MATALTPRLPCLISFLQALELLDFAKGPQLLQDDGHLETLEALTWAPKLLGIVGMQGLGGVEEVSDALFRLVP